MALVMCFMLSITNIYSQERINAELPTFGTKVYGQLTYAVGWIRMGGEWISRTNRIPSQAPKMIMDYEETGLGYDNFTFYQLKDIKIKDSTYMILIKKYRDGFYTYESISEDWNPYYAVDYYVFSKNELNKFQNLYPDSLNVFNIQVLYSGVLNGFWGGVGYIDIQKAIAATSEDGSKYYSKLSFQIAPYKDKNIVQFQIGKLVRPDDHYSFKYSYFETSYASFNGFMKISVLDKSFVLAEKAKKDSLDKAEKNRIQKEIQKQDSIVTSNNIIDSVEIKNKYPLFTFSPNTPICDKPQPFTPRTQIGKTKTDSFYVVSYYVWSDTGHYKTFVEVVSKDFKTKGWVDSYFIQGSFANLKKYFDTVIENKKIL